MQCLLTGKEMPPKRGSIPLIIFIFLLDQISKYFIVRHGSNLPFTITSFFDLVLTWNRGMSFGILNNHSDLSFWLINGTVIGIIAYIIYLLSKETKPLMVISFGWILGGAFGNLADRLFRGGVVDFLDFHLGNLHWPAFNVADTFVVLGVGLFLVNVLWCERK
jgi:signal peptidase II